MRNYIILNNQRSDEISGLIIQELAPISKPLQRTQVETIDGRDGDIVTPLGYAAYDKKVTIGLYGDFDINEIIAYFATQGTAIFSNEPDKYYNYQILDQIDYERLVRFRVATVTMHVQPFKYSATEGTLTIDASDTVSGEGSEIALDNTAEAPFNVLRHKGNATQTTYSGKNLASLETTGSVIGGVSFSIVDGIIHLSGTTETNKNFFFDSFRTNSGSAMFWIEVTGYTVPESGNASFILQSSSDNSTWSNFKELSFRTLTPSEQITLDSTKYYRLRWYVNGNTFTNATIKVQLEYGSAKTSFEQYVGGTASPNPDYPQDIKLLTGDSTITIDDGGENNQEYVIPFGDTYLAKIGDYADEPVKVDGTWYIRRKVGKAIFTGASGEQWGGESYGGYWRVNHTFSDIAPISQNTDFAGLSDYFHMSINVLGAQAIKSGDFCQYRNTSTVYFAPPLSVQSSSDWRTWLSTHPTTVYYPLATPADEEITDQDLIDALDEFYGQAHSYKGHTHITATAADGNAPAVLSVEVGEDNESTVTNAGNTTSRPILTIYGQGDIGVYINDVEVLDIALGNEQYITLDSTEMDAYKDSPANLKNRLVTGDYSKLALNAGANKIRFTGTVTKYEISKYSRWL